MQRVLSLEGKFTHHTLITVKNWKSAQMLVIDKSVISNPTGPLILKSLSPCSSNGIMEKKR